MKLGDFLNSINYTKEDIFEEDADHASKNYPAFVVNRCLSYFPDTLFHANEMNMHHSLSERVQYDYLRLSIRPRKRFSKWLKNEKPEDIEVVKKYYNYSNRKAEDALRVLSSDDIENMKQDMNTGGSKPNSST